MDLRSVPPLSPFNYAEWKLKMVAYLERHNLLDVSFGAGKESYEDENDWIDDGEREYAKMCMEMTLNMHYLVENDEYSFELWINIDREFGVHKEVDNTWSESNTSLSVLSQYVSTTIVSDEFFHDEEVADSTHTVHGATIISDSNASYAYQ